MTEEFATFLDRIETPHKAPLGYVGWFQDFPDPSDFIDPILSCASAVQGGANAAWYCNKDFDAEAASALGETDQAKRLTEYQDIQKKIMAEAPWVPIRHHLVHPHRHAGRRVRHPSGLAVRPSERLASSPGS